MNTTLRNFLVGIFVLGAISIVVSIIFFLKPTVGDGKQLLYARFSDINNLNVGTRVLFAGKAVGEVESITPVEDAREQPTDELGRVYFYQLTLKIDSKVKVYNTDEITIQTSGLLGEKSIAIVPKAPPKGVIPRQIADQPIYADSVDALSNALIEFSELSSNMEEAFREVKSWIHDNGGELGNMVVSARKALDQIDEAVYTINQQGLIFDAQNSFRSFTSTLGNVQEAIGEMQDRQTFKNVGITMKNLGSASHNLDLVTGDIADGRGTLGRLIVDSDMYLKASSVITKANTLMNDLNHYGLLFNQNKQWQRTRLKRINQMHALDSPDSFKAYFEQELDEINTSMSRISMLIESAEDRPAKERIVNSPEFRNDFLDLMQRADELSETLRLYNQDLQEN